MFSASIGITAYSRKQHTINTCETLNYQNRQKKSSYEVIVVDDVPNENFSENLMGKYLQWLVRYEQPGEIKCN